MQYNNEYNAPIAISHLPIQLQSKKITYLLLNSFLGMSVGNRFSRQRTSQLIMIYTNTESEMYLLHLFVALEQASLNLASESQKKDIVFL